MNDRRGHGGLSPETGRTALVTGATRGIGFEVCRQLGQCGIHVLLGARDHARGAAAAAVLVREGLDVRALRLDVTDPTDLRSPSAASGACPRWQMALQATACPRQR